MDQSHPYITAIVSYTVYALCVCKQSICLLSGHTQLHCWPLHTCVYSLASKVLSIVITPIHCGHCIPVYTLWQAKYCLLLNGPITPIHCGHCIPVYTLWQAKYCLLLNGPITPIHCGFCLTHRVAPVCALSLCSAGRGELQCWVGYHADCTCGGALGTAAAYTMSVGVRMSAMGLTIVACTLALQRSIWPVASLTVSMGLTVYMYFSLGTDKHRYCVQLSKAQVFFFDVSII